MLNEFYKKKSSDKIWWKDIGDRFGDFIFSFDKRTEYNLFSDYPNKLTPKQKEVFDKENPQWADFFKDREYQYEGG